MTWRHLGKQLLALGLIALLVGSSSCIFDPDKGGKPPEKPNTDILPLTTREAVLNNLEVAYNTRKTAPYEALLDGSGSFTFFFSPGDFGGGTTPEQWGYLDEINAATRLFNKDPNYPICRSIRMDIQFENGVQWIEVVPDNNPNETWYTTTVYYQFTFEVEPDITYVAVLNSRAQFTVRNTGTAAAPVWKLVEWRDLDAS